MSRLASCAFLEILLETLGYSLFVGKTDLGVAGRIYYDAKYVE